MPNRAFFVGWDRPVPGREAMAVETYASLVSILDKSKASRQIDSYETVLLDSHGGDLNGFVLVRGDQDGIDRFLQSDTWTELQARGNLYLQNFGTVRCVIGSGVNDRMTLYRKLVSELSGE